MCVGEKISVSHMVYIIWLQSFQEQLIREIFLDWVSNHTYCHAKMTNVVEQQVFAHELDDDS